VKPLILQIKGHLISHSYTSTHDDFNHVIFALFFN